MTTYSNETKPTTSFDSISKDTTTFSSPSKPVIKIETLVDSYSEANTSDVNLITPLVAVAQSFIGSAGYLEKCKFEIVSDGIPSNDLVARLWTHTGNFGVDGIPSTMLAESDPVTFSEIPTSTTLFTFNFSGDQRYLLEDGVPYFIGVYLTAGGYGGSVSVSYDATSPTASGNGASYFGVFNFWFNTTESYIFYVYTLNGNGEMTEYGSNVSTQTTSYSGISKPTTSFTNVPK